MNFIEKLKEEFSFFRGNYLILIISWILMDFAGELPGTYYSDYIIQLGGNATIIGVIMLVSMLALASVQFLGGYLADKYGRRELVVTLTYGVALSFILYAAAPSWHFILIGALIQNLCLLYQPALNAMMADSLPPEKRGMGFSILNLIMSVSTTPAPAAALLLVTTFGSKMGMRIAYAVVTMLYVTAATVRIKLKESMKDPEKINLGETLRSNTKALREGINVWKVVPNSTKFVFLVDLIIRSSFAMVQMIFLVYAFYVIQIGGAPNQALAPELDPALQLARIRWGYVIITLFLCMIIFSFPVGKLIDKIGRRVPLILSNLLIIPAILLFIFGNYFTIFITMLLMGLSMLLFFSSSQTLLADLVPQAQRGKVTGSINFFTYIFMAIGGALGGLLYDAISPQAPFLLSATLAIPSIAIILLYIKEPKPEERQA